MGSLARAPEPPLCLDTVMRGLPAGGWLSAQSGPKALDKEGHVTTGATQTQRHRDTQKKRLAHRCTHVHADMHTQATGFQEEGTLAATTLLRPAGSPATGCWGEARRGGRHPLKPPRP